MTSTMTMMATHHNDQLGEIYPTMLNALNCTSAVSFLRSHCCGGHGHGLWQLWFVAVMLQAPKISTVNVQRFMCQYFVKCLFCWQWKQCILVNEIKSNTDVYSD